MARKKPAPKKKTFNHNPFRDLKGLSVSKPDEPEREGPPVAPADRPPKKGKPSESGEDALFREEMARLGLLDEGRGKSPAADPAPEPETPAEAPAAASQDQDEFLAALGSLDITFTDQFDAPEEDLDLPRAAPRRLRQLRQGRIAPEDQLDLHGLHRDQALDRVRWFLEDAVYQGRRTVLLITGRGQHSPQGPVLREAVARYLREDGADLVLEWGTAPPRYGGKGALVVFLRSLGRGERS